MASSFNQIILIGPLATGKSSIASELSAKTGMLNHPIDKLKWYYRHKNGYDLYKSTQLLKSQGFSALLNYAKHYFGVMDIKSILNRFEGIIDLGASDTNCFDLKQQSDIINLMKPYENIFLILPCKKKLETIKILEERLYRRYQNDALKFPVIESYLEMNKNFVNSQTNKLIAKHVIYTNNKSISQISLEILNKCKFTAQNMRMQNVG